MTVAANTSTTTIGFKVGYTREIDYISGGTIYFKSFLAKFKLTVAGVMVSPEYTVTGSDFGAGNSYVELTYSISVNNSLLVNGHYLIAQCAMGLDNYRVYSGFNVTVNNAFTPPVSYSEGNLVMTNDQKVYSIMDGYARHIQTMATLAGVYNYNGYIVNCNCSTLSTPIGTPIAPDTSLLIDNSNGKMYFREGTYIRHIANVPTANKYYFQIYNNNYIVAVNGLSGYTVGPQII
ncbi:MAG: hypothetical protein V4663_04415 [Bacteroidota bacterium]